MATPELIDFVLRHPRERKSKCSLQPLLGRADLHCETARLDGTYDASGYILLAIDAPVLSPADAGKPLFILDSTWRLLPQLEATVTGDPVRRSLPSSLQTAYPRISKVSLDPVRGLASVEALYAARFLQGRTIDDLLQDYFWKDTFLAQFSD